MAEDYGVTINEWVNIVRRARLDRTTKLVALTLASYADPNGSKVYPGLARLVVQCRISYRAAQYALQKLRDAELIEVVRRGNRRRGRSDEYRLVLGANLLDRVQVLSPDEERAVIEAAAAKRRGDSSSKASRESRDGHATTNQAQPGAPEQAIKRNQGPRLGATTDPPPSIGPLPKTKPSIHSALTRGTDASAGRASSADAGSADAASDLDLAEPNGWKKKPRPGPWTEDQAAYDEGRIDENDVLDKLADLLGGWHHDAEERAATGMLANGSKLIVIYNKIRKDRRTQ